MNIKATNIENNQSQIVEVPDDFAQPACDLGGSFYMQIGKAFNFDANKMNREWVEIDAYEHRNPVKALQDDNIIHVMFSPYNDMILKLKLERVNE